MKTSLCGSSTVLRQFQKKVGCDLYSDLVPKMSSTNLFFIDNNAIQYTARSDDPIFPADYSQRSSEQAQPYWENSRTARTILGCSDEKYIRHRKSGREWYLLGDWMHDKSSNESWYFWHPTLEGKRTLPYSNSSLMALQLLCLALRYSDTSNAVYFARTQWLDAASKIALNSLSVPLSSRQWEIESQNLFNISLARMQVDIFSMARGWHLTPSKGTFRPIYDNLTDPCGMLKVQVAGHKNLSVAGLVGMLSVAFGIWIATMEVEDTIVLIWLLQHAAKLIGVCVRRAFCWSWYKILVLLAVFRHFTLIFAAGARDGFGHTSFSID